MTIGITQISGMLSNNIVLRDGEMSQCFENCWKLRIPEYLMWSEENCVQEFQCLQIHTNIQIRALIGSVTVAKDAQF